MTFLHSNKMTVTRVLLLVAVAALLGCSSKTGKVVEPSVQPAAPADATFSLTSSAFADGEKIPVVYTADGRSISPPLAWTDPPVGTAELVLVVSDPDAPSGTWYHWSLYGLVPNVRSLAEGLPKTETVADTKAAQGLNSAGEVGYYPPSPPSGKVHHYIFRLYALRSASGLAPRATPAEVEKAVGERVLAQAQLTGTYQR